MPGFTEGWFAVQDQASALVVRALDPQPGDRVLDVCAAPGGKASFAACLVGEEGLVVAGDLRAGRADLIRRGAQRLGGRVRVLVQDATRPALRGNFDRVLVDAPCSGVGAARRRPELLWRPRAEDLSGLARIQVAIACAAADFLKPGGRLIYSVCTFPRVETDAAADAVLRHRPDLVPVPVPGPEGSAERFRLWPHLHGCDGMFIAGFTNGA
jgi:16S rRNA (cytosine967-C5)-methyltransferase